MNVDNSGLVKEIAGLKQQKNAVVLAHYYALPEVQDIADFTGDSLALALIAKELKNDLIIMCGVHFMGETVKILCPDKVVVVPDPEAGCSLADSCRAEDLREFLKDYPDHKVVSYVNTSADVKALTDIVVTSSNALEIVNSFPEDEKIGFGPDRNLGRYIADRTGRDMVIWNGCCHVHDRFSLEAILNLKKEYPDAKVLVHPECPKPIQLIADVTGSTQALLHAAQNDSDTKNFIVVTESGILHKMRKACPDKNFIPAPPQDSACGCNDCAYMKLNTLEKVRDALLKGEPQIHVDPAVAEKARLPILRMMGEKA